MYLNKGICPECDKIVPVVQTEADHFNDEGKPLFEEIIDRHHNGQNILCPGSWATRFFRVEAVTNGVPTKPNDWVNDFGVATTT